jgi:hypothetical protein
MVRPWALAVPVIVLILAAPLLRPLRAPVGASPRERVTLESVRSVLVEGTLLLNPGRLQPADPVLVTGGRIFSQDPPVYDAVLAGVGWGVERFGVRVATNPSLFAYLLTLFAVTLPTAIAGGLIYRATRVFELPRPWRFGLALACVFASGWFAYATVLLPHAPAAALAVSAITCAVQFAQSKRPGRALGWLALGGLCGATAGVIEPLAIWALGAVALAAVTARTQRRWRVFGLILTIAGAAAPLALHLTLNSAMTGDWRPPRWHVMLPTSVPAATVIDDYDAVPSGWSGLGRGVGRLLTLTVGEHGLLSHFPVLLLGLVGSAMALRRHWTGQIKALAAATVTALVVICVYKMIARPDAIDAGYAAPRLATVAPVLLLWAGTWLRRKHGTTVWILAGVALAVSTAATLIGAASPPPAEAYSRYTFVEAIERLVRGDRPD